jgi:uncharacterized membrane protein
MQHVDLIAEYLLQLQRELAGVDAAVAHDALVDAEAHLRAAVAAGKTPATAVDEFGTASDFARAYAGAPALVDPSAVEGAGATRSGSFAADRASSRTGTLAMLARMPVLGVWFQARAWSSLFYFLLPCFVIAVATFVWVVCVGSLALGTLPIIVGVPLAVFLLGSVRVIGLVEGKVVEFFLGVRMPRRVQPVQVLTPLGAVAQIGFWQRIACWLTDVRLACLLCRCMATTPRCGSCGNASSRTRTAWCTSRQHSACSQVCLAWPLPPARCGSLVAQGGCTGRW